MPLPWFVRGDLDGLGLIHGVTLTPEGVQAFTGWWFYPSFTLAYAARSPVLFSLFFLHRNNLREATHP
ncbi:MAG: hypothetical protein ACEQSM_08405 [Aliarcobacter sp.]